MSIRAKRGTRAQVDAAATGTALQEGELIYITDEQKLAVGQGTSTYHAFTSASDEEIAGKLQKDQNLADVADPTAARANISAAPDVHSHAVADVTGLQEALDGKSPVGHRHVIGDIDNLQSTLDGLSQPEGVSVVGMYVDTFVGNGTAGPYTLSIAPQNKNHCSILLDGAPQEKASFELTGSDITFDEVIPSGASIEVTTADIEIGGAPSDETVTAAKINTPDVGNIRTKLSVSSTAEMNTAITNAVNGLISGAPGALDTLNELAAALGDDANFATTMTNALAGKAPNDGTSIETLLRTVPGGAYSRASVTDTSDWNTIVSPGWHGKLLGVSNANAPMQGSFFHCLVLEYTGGQLTQLAFPYASVSATHNRVFMRGRYQGTWSTWISMLTSKDTGHLSGYRNKVINGGFEIAQRGTSANYSVTASQYLIDRWLLRTTGSADVTLSRQSFAVGQTDVPGNPRNYLRWHTTAWTAAGGVLQHRIEGVHTLAGKKATITFYAKSDAARDVGFQLQQNFGTGGTPSADYNTTEVIFNMTTAWKKFTTTVEVPSISGKTLGTSGNDFLALAFNTPRAVSTFDLARVSFVEGDATLDDDPFSPRHHQQELALCQRYYSETSAYSLITADAAGEYLSDYAEAPVALRATPTVTMSTETANVNSNGPFTDEPSVRGACVYGTAIASGSARFFQRVKFDAEL